MTRWYGPDELRQSWCLLTLDIGQTDSEMYIQGCEIGDGNADQLIDVDTFSAKDLNEEFHLLDAIGTKLDERRYDGVSLVTPTRETLSILRSRFVECTDIPQPTLRGFNHIAISELLDKYFNKNCTRHDSSLINQCLDGDPTSEESGLSETGEISVATLWKVQTTIGPLVPAEALRGRQL